MSYYESNYYLNPGPVYGPEGDKGEPVPGWGPLPNMAGPARVGIGALGAGEVAAAAVQEKSLVARKVPPRFLKESADRAKQREGKTGIPWWAWVMGGVAVGAGLGLARNMGKLKFMPGRPKFLGGKR